MIEAQSPDCLASLSILSLPPSLPAFLPCSPGFSGLCFENCCPIELNPNSLTILLGTFIFSPLPSFHLHHLLTSCLLYLFPSSILKAISFLQAVYDLPLDCTHAFPFIQKTFLKRVQLQKLFILCPLYMVLEFSSRILFEVSKGKGGILKVLLQ